MRMRRRGRRPRSRKEGPGEGAGTLPGREGHEMSGTHTASGHDDPRPFDEDDIRPRSRAGWGGVERAIGHCSLIISDYW
jgi:hypothetical protein